ncbi:MAG: PQQ-dependent sugar dehydrogenase [Meiothermus sp.]|uniref:PQQ-dependent sugar dehydrogenase n=1 Tax=Meiothermus sp. TaxID=1955249 RepID=UPI0025DF59E4|nr:PQQ-dependent sugar dehydrogenase [Meiothermus sp.]MCS7068872.1 PQQ-dependent sugar dehydrogenase [Meiothermus sp.]MDW8425463.1 PQQ-dependent sugar dehydrogenase [Meiothermus sp.]
MRWLALLLLSCFALAQNTPHFRVEEVARNLGVPWSLKFAPDGRLFLTQRDRTTIGVSALDLSTGRMTTFEGEAAVRNEGEAGVMGLELDPDFARNQRLYICYSYWKDGVQSESNRRNRLSSFILSAGRLTQEKVLLDEMLGWWNHNGCRVVWGPDHKLYVSMGDAGDAPSNIPGELGFAAKAQSLKLLAGKIFRINPDGSIPTDNPFYTQASGAARAIWTLGHRNPQGLAFQPGTGLLWSTEHGPNTRDELNIIRRGQNYGWPRCSGTQPFGTTLTVLADNLTFNCTGADLRESYQPALREYAGGNEPTIAPSNLIFYSGKAFPQWRGNLLFVTLKTGRLYRLELRGEQIVNEEILINNQYGRLRDLAEGPDGLIYISTDNGRILRLKPNL